MTNFQRVPEIIIGMVFLFIGHAVLAGVILLLVRLTASFVVLWPLFGISLTQLFYAMPLYRRFQRQRRPYAMKGVVIGALITVLLNGSCFGYVFWMVANMHG